MEQQKARDQFNEQVIEWFWKHEYLDPLPAELERAVKPYTGKDLHKFEEYNAVNQMKIKNSFERAENDFLQCDLSLNITEMPLTHSGGDI